MLLCSALDQCFAPAPLGSLSDADTDGAQGLASSDGQLALSETQFQQKRLCENLSFLLRDWAPVHTGQERRFARKFPRLSRLVLLASCANILMHNSDDFASCFLRSDPRPV